MFSEQSLCNCRTCGKRLTYDTMGAIFHYKWDDVGWAYCKDHIPSASINIDHIDLVGMTYNDGIPSLRVDVDAAMSDGTTIPFSAYLTDIPGIKDILEQIEGTVGKINSLTGHDWVYDPATDEIRVTADADIRNFTPSPIANTKLSKLLKDNTIPTAIRNNVKVTTLGMNGTETFNPTTKVMTVPVKADTNYPHTSSGKTAELAIDLSPYIPEPGDPAKVAYIQKNGTETFNPTTNQLSVPVKADTDQAATGTSLSVTIPVDLTQIIADAMKKVKVVSIAQNGTPTFDGATKKLNVPVKADTDHPDTGSAKTDTLGVDATPVLNAVKVASIEGNGDPTYNATTQKMTVPLKADTNFPTATSEKTDSIDVDISAPIADEQKKVKVDTVAVNGSTSYNDTTKVLTVPVKADTDHPSTGTSKTASITVDISTQVEAEQKKVKVDSLAQNGDASYNATTKTLTVPVKADTDHPDTGTYKEDDLELDISAYVGGGKVATLKKNGTVTYDGDNHNIIVPAIADTDNPQTGVTEMKADLKVNIPKEFKPRVLQTTIVPVYDGVDKAVGFNAGRLTSSFLSSGIRHLNPFYRPEIKANIEQNMQWYTSDYVQSGASNKPDVRLSWLPWERMYWFSKGLDARPMIELQQDTTDPGSWIITREMLQDYFDHADFQFTRHSYSSAQKGAPIVFVAGYSYAPVQCPGYNGGTNKPSYTESGNRLPNKVATLKFSENVVDLFGYYDADGNFVSNHREFWVIVDIGDTMPGNFCNPNTNLKPLYETGGFERPASFSAIGYTQIGDYSDMYRIGVYTKNVSGVGKPALSVQQECSDPGWSLRTAISKGNKFYHEYLDTV